MSVQYPRNYYGPARKPVVCYYFVKMAGKIGQRVEFCLTPAQANQFFIWAPQMLTARQVGRINAWTAKQGTSL